MSREIKFRAWDSKSKKMWTPEVICIKDGQVKAGLVMTPAQAKKGVKEGWFYDNPIMQYTGLKDKNGKEIYEGDICNSVYSVGKVYWNEMTARFSFEFDTDIDGLFEMASGIEGKKFEVIGNIYENPELLEVK